jgi:hypothetical protein
MISLFAFDRNFIFYFQPRLLLALGCCQSFEVNERASISQGRPGPKNTVPTNTIGLHLNNIERLQ